MIYGVDLGMRSIYIYGEDKIIHITTPKTDRWTEVHDMAYEVMFTFFVDDVVFYEAPVLAGPRNIKTVIGLAQTSGALLSGSLAKCYEVPVATWKKEVIGSGNVKKEIVSDWLYENDRVAYNRCGGDQNFMDAACVQKYGIKVMSRLSSPM